MYMKLLATTVLIRSSCVPLVVLALLLSANVALGQQTSEAMTLVYEGIAQRRAGAFIASEQTLQRALISAQLAKNPDDELSARGFLALTYLIAGQATKALELRQENLAFARSNLQRFRFPEKEVESLELLSHSYSALGNYSEAESLLKAALDLTKKSPGSMNPPRLLMRLGITQLLGGELARADQFVTATGAAIHLGGNQAYYSPAADRIQLPPFEAFKDKESFYATALHELSHWTRHETRLDRDLGRQRFGDAGYAREELVAELGSAFLCADLGITPEIREYHADYIGHWLNVLAEDTHAIFQAAAHAQRAADFLQGLQPTAPSSSPSEP